MNQKISFISSLILLLSFTSCTNLIKMDRDNKKITYKDNSQNLYCKNAKLQIFSQNKELSEALSSFLKINEKKFSPLEFWAIFSLIKLKYFPYQYTSKSPMQFFYKTKKDQSLIVFPYQEKKHTFLNAIQFILKKNKSKKTIQQLCSYIDKNFSFENHISHSFSLYLKTKVDFIKQRPLLAKYYMRGSETLRPQEILTPLALTSTLKAIKYRYQVPKNEKRTLHQYYLDKSDTFCSFEPTRKKGKIFSSASFQKSSYFAIKSQNKLIFSSFPLSLESETSKQDFFQIDKKSKFSPICILKNEDQNFYLFSTSSYDLKQQLEHLIHSRLVDSQNLEQVSTYIQHARYEFLSSPSRVLFESEKTGTEDLNNILKIQFPLYHMKSIGEMMAIAEFRRHRSDSGIVIDHRSKGGLKCLAN